MVSEEKMNGTAPPIRSPTKTAGTATFIEESPVLSKYVENSATAATAAELIANPFVTALVVLPTASSLSIRFLPSFARPDISPMPFALSEIGPNVSIAIIIAVVESIPSPTRAIPK